MCPPSHASPASQPAPEPAAAPTPAPEPAAGSAAAGWVETRLRVRYAETDAQGVVYHANYLVYMEVGRSALARERGLPYGGLEARGVNLLVARAELTYKASARYDDALVVRTRVREARGRLITFEYRIEHEESSRLLVTGETRHVCVDDDFKAVEIPSWARDVLVGAATPSAGVTPSAGATSAPTGEVTS